MRTKKSAKQISVLLSILILLSGAANLQAETVPSSYRIKVSTEERSTSATEENRDLNIRSESTLTPEKQARLAWHFRNAARLAQQFATKEGLVIQRQVLPMKIELYDTPEGVAKATGRPRFERLGEAVARIDMTRGIIFLGRGLCEDLYVELGKWFFYEHKFQWGKDRAQDEKRLRLAERFARFCLDKKNWTEEGGSTTSIR